jgi:hypothetical protein
MPLMTTLIHKEMNDTFLSFMLIGSKQQANKCFFLACYPLHNIHSYFLVFSIIRPMNQIICGIIKSTHPFSVKQQLLERLRSTYLQTPCSTTIPITDRACYYIINYVRELTLTKTDLDTLTFSRICLECCHNPECLCSIAEHLINDSHIDLSIPFVQLLSDRLPNEIGRPFFERAIFERHELNNEALHLILLTITKNRQLTYQIS